MRRIICMVLKEHRPFLPEMAGVCVYLAFILGCIFNKAHEYCGKAHAGGLSGGAQQAMESTPYDASAIDQLIESLA